VVSSEPLYILIVDSNEIAPSDSSLIAENDSLTSAIEDSSSMSIWDELGIKIAPDTLGAEVEYNASDSILYDIANEKLYLYGNAYLKYDAIELTAAYVVYDAVEKTLYAEGVIDSLGNMIGRPVLTENEVDYEGDKMSYNFDTRKGRISELGTTDDKGGYLRGAEVLKNEHDELFASDAYYTTCEHEDPHFKIDVDKVKVIPDKLIVTGPANLVIADVKTPLVLPFAIFPLSKGRASGVILPKYGKDRLGYNLRGGGYYWAVNDYLDLAATGDIYTNGTWKANLGSTYKVRYRYSGDIRLSYGVRNTGDRITPDFRQNKDFQVNWSHRMDPKARPNSNFSASVRFGTSSYNQNYNYYNEDVLENTYASSIAWTYNFPRSPINMSVKAGHDQNTNTGKVNIRFPQVSLGASTFYPFKAKLSKGKKQWYEKIGVTYKFNAENSVSTGDSIIFDQETIDLFRYGAKHTLNINSSYTVLKHFRLTPRFNYTERWNFSTLNQSWDETVYLPGDTVDSEILVDTLDGQIIDTENFGFNAVRDFGTGVNLSTRVYGMFNIDRGNVKAIRHVMSPSLGFSYRPDFGTDYWGYYDDLIYGNGLDIDTLIYDLTPSDWRLYGQAPKGLSSSINFSIDNNIEMKTLSAKDTVETEQKIKLLESISARTSYNVAAEEYHLAPISLSARTKILKKINLNANAIMDPYGFDEENGDRIPTYLWVQDRKLARLSSASVTIGGSFSSKELEQYVSNKGSVEELEDIYLNPDSYIDYNNPWSFNINYRLGVNRTIESATEDTITFTQQINLGTNLNITPKWKLIVSSGYDFTNQQIARSTIDIARDLHCWEMSVSASPFGSYKYYFFRINVKSAVLQDLKLSRRRDFFDF